MKGELNSATLRLYQDKIISLGLTLIDPTLLLATWNDGIDLIDFSAVDPDKYSIHAIKMANKLGFDEGYNQMKSKFKELIS